MFAPSNKILIIDDVKEELFDLAEVFLSNGVTCRTILYDGSYNQPLKGVRIAFFDIKLLGKSFDITQNIFDYREDRNLSSVFNDLAIAIQNCIDKENGPYALIFWSKNIKVIPNFIEYVRDRFPDLTSPILIDAIDKTTFSGKSSLEFNDKINEIFKDKSIQLLFEFENNCNNAASETVNEIFDIIPKNNKQEDQLWANNIDFENNFDLIFSLIASKTLGIEHAKSNIDRAVVEALLPAINYSILNNSIKETNWKKFLKSINKENLTSLKPQGFKESRLNTIFHIDKVSVVTPNTRGAVFEYNFNSPSCIVNLWFSLVNYFKGLEDDSINWISKFFLFNEGTSKEIKDGIRGNSKFIVIEISASCDFSQNKNRNNKFVLGLMTPIDAKNYFDENKISNSVFYKDIPEFYLNGGEYKLWINFNYVISDFTINKNFGEPLFILKKEIIDMIGNRYANHISRIGITSF